MRIVTIGVYGFDATTFAEALRRAKIDVFIDTRRRRAVRGARYSLANSQRLQALLRDLGIRYVHRLDLAPTRELVKSQDAVDHANRIRRSDRATLTPEFRAAYARECLDDLDARALVASLGEGVDSILIFCVERDPDACHRSLLAARLAAELDATVEHITP